MPRRIARRLPRTAGWTGPAGGVSVGWRAAGEHAAVTTRPERRLSAIMAADVAGYRRLRGRGEEGTVGKLRSCLAAVAAIMERDGGHVVDTAGDGLLAEFPSAVRAVEAAVAIQGQVEALGAGNASDGPLRFRIGINVGDVVVEEGR